MKNLKTPAAIALFSGICALSWFDSSNEFWWIAAILWIGSIIVSWQCLSRYIKNPIPKPDMLTVLLTGLAIGIIFASCYDGGFHLRLIASSKDTSSFIFFVAFNLIGVACVAGLLTFLIALCVGGILCKCIGKDTDFLMNISLIAGAFLTASHVCGVIDLNILTNFIFSKI